MQLSQSLIQSTDSTPLSESVSTTITDAIRAAGFTAIDNGHHILVTSTTLMDEPWECAAIYLEGSTLWIKVMAKRWWSLWTAGDRLNRYEALWEAIDGLQGYLESLGVKIEQGTLAELKFTRPKEKAASSVKLKERFKTGCDRHEP